MMIVLLGLTTTVEPSAMLDARAPVGLCLHRVAGIKLNVAISNYHCRVDERITRTSPSKDIEARSGQWIGVEGNVLERVAVLPDVHARPAAMTHKTSISTAI